MKQDVQIPSITAVPKASHMISIISLVIMVVSLVACPIIVVQSVKGSQKIWFTMDAVLPALTSFYMRLSVVLMQHWYLWLALSLVLVIMVVLWEFVFQGKRRWLNIILSLTASVICWLLSAGARFAVTQPLANKPY